MKTRKLDNIFADAMRELQWNGVRVGEDSLTAVTECLKVIESAAPTSLQYAAAVTALNDLMPMLEEVGVLDTYALRACDPEALVGTVLHGSTPGDVWRTVPIEICIIG